MRCEDDDDAPVGMRALARSALGRYALGGEPRLAFVRHGENTIYRVDAGGRGFALRLHRPGYQTVVSLCSEFAWAESLQATGIQTPAAVAGRDGELVQLVADRAGQRLASLVVWMDGVPMTRRDRPEVWTRLGEIMAMVHLHGRTWRRPDWFVRRTWDLEGLVGDEPLWGDPLRLGRWTAEERSLLEACRELVRERLAGYERTPDRFGLIHADLSFENVLVQDDGTTVLIDFDDGGFGWFAYDLAVALFPYEDEPGFRDRAAALVSGYRSVAPLGEEDVARLRTFLMARRLATLGWTFTHGETRHAREQRARRLATLPGAAVRFLAAAEEPDEIVGGRT